MLRGVAAVLVVVLHGSTIVTERFHGGGEIWWNGAAGVDIFFVISGFVMALSSRSLVGRARPATEFMKRRLERVVPLYWMLTTLKVGLVLAVPGIALRGLGGAWHVVASYLFVPSRGPAGGVLPVVSVGWTLNFEMLFYVLFARRLLCGSDLCGCWGRCWCCWRRCRGLGGWQAAAVLSLCHPIVLEFLFGMLLYELWVRVPRMPRMVSFAGLLVGAAGIAGISWGWMSLLRPLVWGVPAALIVGAAIFLEPDFGRGVPRWLLEVGDSSYAIYLTQSFVLPGVAALLGRMPFAGVRAMAPVMVISIVSSVAVGVVVHRVIELPIIRYFLRRRRMGALPAAV